MIIAQISDPHIIGPQAGAEAAAQSEALLQRAIEHLLRLAPLPDVVLITGDCTNNGHPAEYARFRELLGALPMPAYSIPGNHDDRAQMLAALGPQGASALPGFVQYVADHGPLRLVALDTNLPQRGEGRLLPAQLDWLDARLAEAPERPTILFMHHPPFLTGLRPFDQIGLLDAEAFGAVVARHPQVERIVCGHVHSSMQRRFAGTLAMTCPSTAAMMLPDFRETMGLAVTLEPPGCLLHVWNDASGLLSYSSQFGAHGPAVVMHDGERWVV